jgi:glutamyl-tRNA synthetase
MSVVSRIAPSPTGDPHVGTAYVALFNWAWARKHGGRFILRIEDTDRARSTPESEAQIEAALSWLGLEADESPSKGGSVGPYRQSERGAIYKTHAEQLISSGHAYRCFCSPERLAELRTFQKAAKRPTGYDGACREILEEVSTERALTERHTVRLAVPRPGTTRFTDLLRGEIVIDNANVDDQVLVKSDGMPTYHMANVVDDKLMGVTIVMRAEEWIPSTPKHILLYSAFGWDLPTFAHVPLLRNADKSKISKRKNPTSLLWYRTEGYLPEALLNFLGLQGWSPREEDEEFSIEEFIEKFDPKDISTGGPVFDFTKLDWLNGEKIRKLSVDELADRLMAEGFAESWEREEILDVLPLFQDRLRKLNEFSSLARYLRERVEPDLEGLAKKVKKADPAALNKAMLAAAKRLVEMDGRTEDEREVALRGIADANDIKHGQLFMGLRVAITGAIASPPLLPSVDRLGAQEAAERVRDLVGRLSPTT